MTREKRVNFNIEKLMPASLSVLLVDLLSLTLRDAQHLSYKTLKKLENFNKANSAKYGSLHSLTEKTAILEQLNNNDPEKKNQLANLLSEVLFICFVQAEQHDISLEDSFLQSVDDLILGFVN